MKHRLVNVFYSKDQLLHICKIETGDVHVSETCYIESFTEVKEFLHSIRKVGATNSNEGSYCQSPHSFVRCYAYTKETSREMKG